MKTIEYGIDLENALDRVSFDNTALAWGWRFDHRPVWDTNGCLLGWLIHAKFERPDTATGEMGTGKTREEFVAYGASEDAAVKTAYVVVKLTVEHELMEAFRVDGKRVFDPHNSIEALKGLQS